MSTVGGSKGALVELTDDEPALVVGGGDGGPTDNISARQMRQHRSHREDHDEPRE